jgi:hypothetical protein
LGATHGIITPVARALTRVAVQEQADRQTDRCLLLALPERRSKSVLRKPHDWGWELLMCVAQMFRPHVICHEEFSIMRASFILTHRVPASFDFMQCEAVYPEGCCSCSADRAPQKALMYRGL